MLNDNNFMSVTDAAEALGISRQWLHKLVKAGKAPAHIQVAGRTIFDRADVERHAKK